MNKGSRLFIIFLAFLLFCYSTSARLLLPKQEVGERKLVLTAVFSDEIPVAETEGDDISNLMGSDSTQECGDDDNSKECLKRRMLDEAHLDYIYSQRNNKP